MCVCVCVCVCVCPSVTKLVATYLICESTVWCYKVPYGIPNTLFVWISLKTLCLPVLASFADSKLPASGSITLRVNICRMCVARYIR